MKICFDTNEVNGITLDELILLKAFQEWGKDKSFFNKSISEMQKELPFWSRAKIFRLTRSLCQKGYVTKTQTGYKIAGDYPSQYETSDRREESSKEAEPSQNETGVESLQDETVDTEFQPKVAGEFQNEMSDKPPHFEIQQVPFQHETTAHNAVTCSEKVFQVETTVSCDPKVFETVIHNACGQTFQNEAVFPTDLSALTVSERNGDCEAETAVAVATVATTAATAGNILSPYDPGSNPFHGETPANAVPSLTERLTIVSLSVKVNNYFYRRGTVLKHSIYFVTGNGLDSYQYSFSRTVDHKASIDRKAYSTQLVPVLRDNKNNPDFKFKNKPGFKNSYQSIERDTIDLYAESHFDEKKPLEREKILPAVVKQIDVYRDIDDTNELHGTHLLHGTKPKSKENKGFSTANKLISKLDNTRVQDTPGAVSNQGITNSLADGVLTNSTLKGKAGKKRQNSDEPNNKQIIAELVRYYRSIRGIKPEAGDYPLIGRMYNEYGYDRVFECIYELQKKVESGFMPDNPKIYLMGMLKKKRQSESLESDKSDGSTPLTLSPEIEKAVKEVFDYYLEVFDGLLTGKMTLTEQRKAKIAERLMNGYTVEDIKIAIENIRCSDFHCGQNKDGIFYATIEFICANDTRLEEWINKVPPEKRAENQRLREIEKMLKSLGY